MRMKAKRKKARLWWLHKNHSLLKPLDFPRGPVGKLKNPKSFHQRKWV